MTIHLTFKRYPPSGKYMKMGKRDSYWVTGPDKKERRLPKFLWDRL